MARDAAKNCTMHRIDPTSVIWSKMSLVLQLKNPDLEETRIPQLPQTVGRD